MHAKLGHTTQAEIKYSPVHLDTRVQKTTD